MNNATISSNAAKELAKRKARDVIIRRGDYRGLLLFIDTIFKHHYKKKFRKTFWDELLSIALMDIYHAQNDRLIIEMPPRTGKTERAVRMFSSYVQGVDPACKFQYATYGATLSIVVSSETKEIMESKIYNEIFNIGFSPKLNLKEHWKLTAGGGFLGTSVGGSNTGMGANIAIGDDLLKAAEAHSKAARDNAYNFYNSSMLTRLEAQKGVILIMQRLHEDDIVGRVLKENKLKEEGGIWTRISLPLVNSFDQFEAFYNWCEGTGQDTINMIEQKELDSAISQNAFETPKEYKRKYYNQAREIYLRSRDIQGDFVNYKDNEIYRPPLTTLDDEEYGLDFAISQRKQMSLSEFKKQYFQDAEVSEAGHFKKEHFKYVVDIDLPQQYHYIIVDNAESQEASADDRGIVVVGKSISYEQIVRTVIMDGAYGKWNVYGTCENIIRLAIKFPDAPILIEGAGGGITLETVLKKEIMIYNAKAQSEGKKLVTNQIILYKPDNQTSKNAIIKVMDAPMEHGFIEFYKWMDQKFLEQLEKEFLKFNPEKKNNEDNCIDPLAKSFVLQWCNPRSPTKDKPKIPKHKRKRMTKTWRGY